jgi:hypothetical protein
MLRDSFIDKAFTAFMIVFFIAAGGWLVLSEARFWASVDRASGIVVNVEHYSSSGYGTSSYYVDVRFSEPRRGQTITFRNDAISGWWSSPFDVGEKVLVAYDPARPEGAGLGIELDPKALAKFSVA